MASWPTVDDYKAWARIADDRDDPAITESLAAVTTAVMQRCGDRLGDRINPLVVATEIPDDVHTAVLLWVNRLQSRRNSPDGIVGVADLGVATVRSFDADIARLLAPSRNVVLG